MAEDDRFSRVLAVLDAKVGLLESRHAKEMTIRTQLRAKQLAIVEQEDELMLTLQADSVRQPAMFRYGELRLRKLMDDQSSLQTILAKAALQRGDVHEELRAVLRQRLALTAQSQRRSAEAQLRDNSALQDLLPFFAIKRGQNVS